MATINNEGKQQRKRMLLILMENYMNISQTGGWGKENLGFLKHFSPI